MIDLLEECRRLLSEAAIATGVIETNRGSAIAFEGTTVLGFIVVYNDPAHLLDRWGHDAAALIADNQLSLRRAQAKAWNTYMIFLAEAAASKSEQRVALSAIEEDLVGTRKVARVGIRTREDLRAALLPLLPIQNVPRLEAVNMVAEIDLRTTELPERMRQAFLSRVPEAVALHVLEEEP
jgi:hypothetical protein